MSQLDACLFSSPSNPFPVMSPAAPIFPPLSPSAPSFDLLSQRSLGILSCPSSPRGANGISDVLGFLNEASATPPVTRSPQEEYLANIAAEFEARLKNIDAPDVFALHDLLVISDSFGPGGQFTGEASQSIVLTRPKNGHQQPFVALWDRVKQSDMTKKNAASIYVTLANALGDKRISADSYGLTAHLFCRSNSLSINDPALRQFYPRTPERIKTLSNLPDCVAEAPFSLKDVDGLPILEGMRKGHEELVRGFQTIALQPASMTTLDTGVGFYKLVGPSGSNTIYAYRSATLQPWFCLASIQAAHSNPAPTPAPKPILKAARRTLQISDDEDSEFVPPKKAARVAQPPAQTTPKKKAAAAPAPAAAAKKHKPAKLPDVAFRPSPKIVGRGLAPPPAKYEDQLATLYRETCCALGAPGRRSGALPVPAEDAPIELWALYYRTKALPTPRKGCAGQSPDRLAYIGGHNLYTKARAHFAAHKVLPPKAINTATPLLDAPKKQEMAKKPEKVEQVVVISDGVVPMTPVPATPAAVTTEHDQDFEMEEIADSQAETKETRCDAPPPPPPSVEPPAAAAVNVAAIQRACDKDRIERQEFAGAPYIVAEPEGFARVKYALIPVTDREGQLVKPPRFVYQADASIPAAATIMGHDLNIDDLVDEIHFILDTYGLSKEELESARASISGQSGAPRFRFALSQTVGTTMIREPFLASLDDGQSRPKFLRGIESLGPYLHDMAAIMATHGRPANYVYELYDAWVAKSRQ